jgi:glycosyltransferase involved in cell wall biosynthesis
MMKSTVDNREGGKAFVLVSAAYNEDKLIENVIKSVVMQEHKPLRWVIVSDGSTDCTDEIVKAYAARHEFIRLHRVTEDHPRNFTAQVYAINAGLGLLREVEYQFIGNLDADITLDPDYFARLIGRFQQEPRLGLAGGYIHEMRRGRFGVRKTNNRFSVAHGVQLFRRECFEDIGGAYEPLPYGGPDWYAEIKARMRNWEVRAFPDLKVYHHRPTSSAEGFPRNWYRQGLLHYSFGSHPIFEVFKAVRRMRSKPYVLGAAVMFSAFVWAHARREKRCVPPEMIEHLREEQMNRVANLFSVGHGRKAPLDNTAGM